MAANRESSNHRPLEYWIPDSLASLGFGNDEAVVSIAIHGHFTTGGIEERIESTLPPVLRPNTVPRS
jgi:hypothetical protein